MKLASLLLLSLHLVACADETPSEVTARPGVGSTFTFKIYPLDEKGGRIGDPDLPRSDSLVDDAAAEDSLGAPADSGAGYPAHDTARSGAARDTVDRGRTEVVRVVATGVEEAGRSNVTVFEQNGEKSYLAYESNGDIAILLRSPDINGGEPLWVRYPTGATSTVDTLWRYDTVVSQTPISMKLIAFPEGGEKTLVAGRLMEIRSASVEFRTLFQSQGGLIIAGTRQTIWYAPELGFLVRMEQRGIGADSYGSEEQSLSVLESFSLVPSK